MSSTKTFTNRFVTSKGMRTYSPALYQADEGFYDDLNFRFRQGLADQVPPKTIFALLGAVNTPSTETIIPPPDPTTYTYFGYGTLGINAGGVRTVYSKTFSMTGSVSGTVPSAPDFQTRWNILYGADNTAPILYSDQNSLTTSVTVPDYGTYTVRLYAGSPESDVWGFDTVIVQVLPPYVYFEFPALINPASGNIYREVSVDGGNFISITPDLHYNFTSSITLRLTLSNVGNTGFCSNGIDSFFTPNLSGGGVFKTSTIGNTGPLSSSGYDNILVTNTIGYGTGGEFPTAPFDVESSDNVSFTAPTVGGVSAFFNGTVAGLNMTVENTVILND